jgi:hypothetical protein
VLVCGKLDRGDEGEDEKPVRAPTGRRAKPQRGRPADGPKGATSALKLQSVAPTGRSVPSVCVETSRANTSTPGVAPRLGRHDAGHLVHGMDALRFGPAACPQLCRTCYAASGHLCKGAEASRPSMLKRRTRRTGPACATALCVVPPSPLCLFFCSVCSCRCSACAV